MLKAAMRAVVAIVLGIVLAEMGLSGAFAQQPTPGQNQDVILRNSPELQLTPAQKQTIYTSISNRPEKETAPPNFRAAVGEIVPPPIGLQPLPRTIVELMPQIKDMHYAMVTNQVLLVDPANRRIVDIISQ